MHRAMAGDLSIKVPAVSLFKGESRWDEMSCLLLTSTLQPPHFSCRGAPSEKQDMYSEGQG